VGPLVQSEKPLNKVTRRRSLNNTKKRRDYIQTTETAFDESGTKRYRTYGGGGGREDHVKAGKKGKVSEPGWGRSTPAALIVAPIINAKKPQTRRRPVRGSAQINLGAERDGEK